MFGDNADVLPPEPAPRGGGYGFAGGGSGGGHRRGNPEETGGIELSLDVAFFEDGLTMGPDESGLFESVTQQLDRQRAAAGEIAEALRRDAATGQVFEILRPMARDAQPQPDSGGRAQPAPFMSMFAGMALRQLVNLDGPELLAWFERMAELPSVRLHRPA